MLCAALVWAAGCSDSAHTFNIEGTVPSVEYDGEWIYLVPLENAPGRVDSVLISNASFTFTGKGEEMRVLRVRHALRHAIQELLVVTEPGTIRVHADSAGTVTGTPQNDRLQAWKEMREVQGARLSPLWKQWKASNDSTDFRRYRLVSDSLRRSETDYTCSLMEEMGNTTLSRFFYKNFKGRLSEEQRNELITKGVGE